MKIYNLWYNHCWCLANFHSVIDVEYASGYVDVEWVRVQCFVDYNDYAVGTMTTTATTIMMTVDGNQLLAFGPSDYVTK